MDAAAVEQAGWTRVGENDWVRTERAAHVNLGLVVGAERALVVDTGAGPRSAQRQLDAVRLITDLPLIAVNTHHHYDHALGNDAFALAGVTEVWGHPAAIAALNGDGERLRAEITDEDEEPQMRRAEGPGTRIIPPTHAVTDGLQELDLGDHQVTLTHLGRAHTAGDILVSSGTVVFAGDVVEQGNSPQFADSYPREWLKVLGKIIALDEIHEHVVPGHGQVMSPDLVRGHYHRLDQAIRVAETALDEHATDATKSIPVLPFGPIESRHFLNRLKETRDEA
jgi:glyoxylase-like metal-dependent hydrolase (beta-lactamase superfamily II)